MAGTLSDIYWNRAEESLRSARLLFEAGNFNSASNRAYYAAFHAATSLLLHMGIETRTHAGAMSMFGREVIRRRNLLPQQLGKTYSKLYEFRVLADYPSVPVSITREEAETALRDAETFVTEVGRVRRVVS